MSGNKPKITVEVVVMAPIEIVWEYFTEPQHITNWNHASEDWHSPKATNNLRIGGTFSYRMEAKDGSFGFDFGGTYNNVILHKTITYTIGDGRQVSVNFVPHSGQTRVVETFEAENQNPIDMQQKGWQAILDSFKKYVESRH